MRGLRFLQSTTKRVLEAGCVGLSCLFAIALTACEGGTPATDSPCSWVNRNPTIAFASIGAGGYTPAG